MTPIEIIAVISGFLCVYFTIKENILCWPTGLLQVSLYIFIFYDAKLYSDVILHIIYVAMNIYGWYYWLHGGKMRKEARVKEISRAWLTGSVIGSVLATVLLGWFMATRTDASFPYPDAFTTIFSLVAQWLMSLKRLESWYFWIAVDVVAVGVYYAKGLYLTTGLYSLFLIMAVIGLLKWRRSLLSGQDALDDVELEPAA